MARLDLRCDVEKRKDKEGRNRTLRDQAGKGMGGRKHHNVWDPSKKGCLRKKSQDSKVQAKTIGA